MSTDPKKYDCVRCGACCCNIDKNRALSFRDYVEVEPRDKIRKNKKLIKLYVIQNDAGEVHMKLSRSQRCVALAGRLGKKVACTIYPWRPSGCRRVEPGDYECRRARRERGIDPAPAQKRRPTGAGTATGKSKSKSKNRRRSSDGRVSAR